MKRLFILTFVLMFSACAQSGDGFVQEPPPASEPDPIITESINSRLVGRMAVNLAGQAMDLDTILEFREKEAGKLIGYGQARDQLKQNTLFIDFWQTGQRTNANVTFNIRLDDRPCLVILLVGKINAVGNVKIPKTTQTVCGFKVITEAIEFTREGEANKFSWNAIELHFASK
jgi:hypothetical protein